MTIDVKKLDKRRTYAVLEYGTSWISKAIHNLTKDIVQSRYPEVKQMPSHILILAYTNRQWIVYESHLAAVHKYHLPSGTRTYTWETFKQAFPKIVESTGDVYPLRVKEDKLVSLLNQPYGIGDIKELAKYLTFKGLDYNKQEDKPGYICSEYVATCCSAIRKYFHRQPYQITPAHFLLYFLNSRIPKVKFEE